MRRDRRQRPFLRGLLLFVLGALVGANATYFVMTRDVGPPTATQVGERIETPLPTQPATEAGAGAMGADPASSPTGPMLPPPAVRATGVGAATTDVPVASMPGAASSLADTRTPSLAVANSTLGACSVRPVSPRTFTCPPMRRLRRSSWALAIIVQQI